MERHLGSRTSWLKRRRWSCCAPGSRDSQGRPSLSHEETGGSKTLELKADGDPVGLSADVGIVVLLEDGELVGLSADVGIVVLPASKLTEDHGVAKFPYMFNHPEKNARLVERRTGMRTQVLSTPHQQSIN
ncbi:hypothetical protein N665_1741s0001 [Sinapis alba]|nr:hypothetical protein N665_1741s0001 [Sinapis alba]